MSQSANSVRATHHRQLRLIPESVVNQHDTGAAALLCDDLSGPFVAKPVTGKKEHSPQGANGVGYVARHRSHTELSGLSIDPDYKATKKYLDGIYARVSKTVVGQVDRYIYRKKAYVDGAVQSYTAEFGHPADADRATGFFLSEFEIGSGRKNEPSASASGFARKATKGVTMSGAVAQNSVYALGGANVAGNVVLSIKVGAAAAENVTLSPGDNAQAIEAKILAQTTTITAVVVTGAINGGSGDGTLLNRAGWTMSASSFFDVYNVMSVKDGDPGSVWAANLPDQHMTVDFGAPASFTGYRFRNRDNDANARPRAWSVYTSNTGVFGGEEVLLHSVSNESSASPTVEKMVAGTARYVRFLFTEVNGAPYVTIGELDFLSAPSAATSNATIEFTGPANTPVSVTKVSGTNYTVAAIQIGGNGETEALEPAPITASDWAIRRAALYGDLSDAGTLIDTAYDYKLKIGDIFAPHWTANESETYDRVKRGKTLHTAEISLDDATDGHMAAIEEGADEAANRVSVPAWYEFGHRSGDELHALLFRAFMAVSSDIEPEDEDDVEGRKVELTEIVLGTGEDFCVEVVLDLPTGTFAD